MSDVVTRFLFEDLDIRGATVRLTNTWQLIHARRDYPVVVLKLIGELCAATAIIGANLKQSGRLTLQLSGHGPISLMVIDCSASLNLRGYAKHSTGQLPEAGLSKLLGDGRLLMTLDTVGARQPYQSYVPVEDVSVAKVFENYLARSEQQPALLFLGADETHAAGLFLQRLPDADVKDPDGWNRITLLAQTIKTGELLESDAEQLLTRLFPEETIRVFDGVQVRHDFPPDREKIRNMLRSLGQGEVEKMILELGEIVVRDDLSNHEYRFSAQEARALFT